MYWAGTSQTADQQPKVPITAAPSPLNPNRKKSVLIVSFRHCSADTLGRTCTSCRWIAVQTVPAPSHAHGSDPAVVSYSKFWFILCHTDHSTSYSQFLETSSWDTPWPHMCLCTQTSTASSDCSLGSSRRGRSCCLWRIVAYATWMSCFWRVTGRRYLLSGRA